MFPKVASQAPSETCPTTFLGSINGPSAAANRDLRVLFASPEQFPLAKTGGLADVSAALPAALAALGADTHLVMPGYAEAPHKAGAKVGLCGEAPSNHPEFAEFLVQCGIDSMSVSPDSFFEVKRHVAATERPAGSTRRPTATRPAGASAALGVKT